MIKMIFVWMVFSVVIAFVSSAFVPKETELLLSFAAFEPVEAHFERSHAFDDDGVVCKSFGGGVVDLDR